MKEILVLSLFVIHLYLKNTLYFYHFIMSEEMVNLICEEDESKGRLIINNF